MGDFNQGLLAEHLTRKLPKVSNVKGCFTLRYAEGNPVGDLVMDQGE